ncbi:MAG: hypothetical protein IPP63_19455 [Chloracidobacterium sp.]|nr:hypothetical protein [Chloracidobacterium sp.]
MNRILINGNELTKSSAVSKALAFRSGDLLKATDIYSSEQNLYGSDAFSRVDIKTQPAGDKTAARRLTDVIVNLEEQPSRLLSYGGGFSTDLGLSGFSTPEMSISSAISGRAGQGKVSSAAAARST